MPGGRVTAPSSPASCPGVQLPLQRPRQPSAAGMTDPAWVWGSSAGSQGVLRGQATAYPCGPGWGCPLRSTSATLFNETLAPCCMRNGLAWNGPLVKGIARGWTPATPRVGRMKNSQQAGPTTPCVVLAHGSYISAGLVRVTRNYHGGI